MARIFEAEAGAYACPYRDFQPCLGAKCMAWIWLGRTQDVCETDNLVETEEGPRPLGEPLMPDGEGWQMDGPARPKTYHRSAKDKLPPGKAQRWVRARPLVEGCCGQNRHLDSDPYSGW